MIRFEIQYRFLDWQEWRDGTGYVDHCEGCEYASVEHARETVRLIKRRDVVNGVAGDRQLQIVKVSREVVE